MEVLTANGSSGVAAVAQLLLRSSGFQKDGLEGIEAKGKEWYAMAAESCSFKVSRLYEVLLCCCWLFFNL